MVLGLREIRCSGVPDLDRENGEELMRVQPGTDIVLGNLPRESPGTLYITTKQVIWVNDVDKTKGYAVDFLSISLHAVSTDPEAYPLPCLYTQIDTEEADHEHSDSEPNHIEQDLSNVTEMRLIPTDPTQLDTLFAIFCQCAELNPEPNDDEGEEEHDWVFSADQMVDEEAEDEGYISHNPVNSIGQSNGNHDLGRSILELQINDRRFEDAEEMDDNGDGTHH
ncbi:chloride conductance regulatory protein ICln [Vigna radiata var. radiata]|uniref:Chloride conductance regulatory protein ICln n=1 Tax=Vigna radiata var. radiata TaxID=3916 RepID=A0A1S3TEK1_VIGRR|nr:chloride conductance regulatory protein ICln [Vigna radiata var. radiata]XP_014492190.1 chloride conductance regulatory protein ICln [Vigna radiata var. radiata]